MNSQGEYRVTPPTAHDVFMYYVKRLSNGDIDCNDIFSPACFEKFIATRKGTIQHPEQTFHRTVVTHIRGIDKRKPFPAEVESEILKLVRDESFNIWDNCFPEGNSFNIGRHGFKHLGYHEKIQLDRHNAQVIEPHTEENISSSKEQSQADIRSVPSGSSSTVSSDALPLRRKRSRENSVELDGAEILLRLSASKPNSICSRTESSNFSPQKRENNNSHSIKFAETYSSIGQPKIATDNPSNSRQVSSSELTSQGHLASMYVSDVLRESLNLPRQSTLTASGVQVITPWDMLWGMMRKNNLLHYATNVETVCEKYGLIALPPVLEFLLKHPTPAHDIRYSTDFNFPPPNECYFEQDRPIGRLVYNRTSLLIEESNLEADRIFGASIQGTFMYGYLASLFDMWYSFIWFLPMFRTGVPIFKRLSIRRRDNGEVVWILARCRLDGENIGDRSIMDIQEILNMPSEVLSRPFLI